MKSWRSYLAGILTAVLVSALAVGASATTGKVTRELEYRDITVTLDGEVLDLRNAIGQTVEPFLFGGTNYLPARALAEALGLNVAWNGQTATVVLTTPSPIPEEESKVPAVLERVDAMAGLDFEWWTAALLRRVGFSAVEVTQASGDQGVDVTAEREGIRYAVQCKRYSSNLGNDPVQEVYAGRALYHAQVGAVITNQHFTAGAKELAESNGVLLWDRDWIEAKLKALEAEGKAVDFAADRPDTAVDLTPDRPDAQETAVDPALTAPVTETPAPQETAPVTETVPAAETPAPSEDASVWAPPVSTTPVVPVTPQPSTDTPAPASDPEPVQDTSPAATPSTGGTSSGGTGNADNFNTWDLPENQQTDAVYVLNNNTMKIHWPSCREVRKIAPQNYATSNDSFSSLIAHGYSPCGICDPF